MCVQEADLVLTDSSLPRNDVAESPSPPKDEAPEFMKEALKVSISFNTNLTSFYKVSVAVNACWNCFLFISNILVVY